VISLLSLKLLISDSEAFIVGDISGLPGSSLVFPARPVHVTDVFVDFVLAATPERLISFDLAARAAPYWTPESYLVFSVERVVMASELSGSTEAAPEAREMRAS
jgi:hypothetical protein